MNIQEKINDNMILHYVVANNWSYDDGDNKIVTVYELSFTFYDCQYLLWVTLNDLETDDGVMLQAEGQSKLFESFSSFSEENWDLIKAKIKAFDEYRLKQAIED